MDVIYLQTKFEYVFAKYRQPLISYAQTLVWNQYLSEDIVHDVFIIYLCKGNKNENELTQRSFLYRCQEIYALDI